MKLTLSHEEIRYYRQTLDNQALALDSELRLLKIRGVSSNDDMVKALDDLKDK